MMKVHSKTEAHSSLSIVLKETSVELRANGCTTGVIFWKVKDVNFPDESWNDFVIVVVTWWMDAIYKLLCGFSTAESFDFMDGPFSISCKVDGNLATCQLLEDGESNCLSPAWSGPVSTLAKAVYDAGYSTRNVLQSQGIVNEESAVLSEKIDRLNELLSSVSDR